MSIATVTGPIPTQQLGKTLMHEHLVVSFPGWETDTLIPKPERREIMPRLIDRIEEMKAAGFTSMVDPCPSDMGRDVELMAEVATRTNFNLVCATGLYNEKYGGSPYWRMKFASSPDGVEQLTNVMIKEITDGVGDTGVRAGVIKVATYHPPFTEYEKKVFEAAAKASLATGVPIMTHTEGILGLEQVEILGSFGVSPHKVIVGHCCCSTDHDYHLALMQTGTYLGFDRFGRGDEEKINSMVALVQKGGLNQIIISHDLASCFYGKFLPDQHHKLLMEMDPLHIVRRIIPTLKERGLSTDDIDTLLTVNPQRFFEGKEI